MKKTLAFILALVFLMTCFIGLAGCGNTKAGTGGANNSGAQAGKDITKDKIQIAFIPMSTAGQVNTIVKQATDAIMASYKNVTINFFDAQFDPNTQIKLINECVTQGYSAIVMECADSTAVGPAITEAEKAGVAVITSNLNCDAVHTMYVKCDSYSGGWVSAEAMVKKLNEKGNVLLLDVPAAQAVSTTFCQGFKDYAAKYPDIKILEYVNLKGNAQEDAYNVMRDMLTKYDTINGVYAPDDNYGLGIIQAIKEAGRQNDGILVWGTDLQPGGIDAIQSGELTGSCWSDRYSAMYAAFSNAIYFAQAGINSVSLGYTKTPSLYVNFVAVTQDNIKQILPLTRWPGY
jgi:ABC-type sugar transport system substrate-binding protein